MKRKNYNILILIIIFGILLTGCSGRSAMTASGWASITADLETAYISFNTQVIAVNLDSGTERWRYPSEADPKITFYAAPEISEDGHLVVGGYDNVLYKINSQNGQGSVLFEGADGRFIGSPLVASEKIFAPSADHILYAINENGQELWQFETGEPLWAKPATDANCNCIYITSMDHMVYAINSTNGTVKWQSEDLGGAIVGTPAISDDLKVYVGTFGNELVALDASNGQELWRFKTADWIWAGPTIHDESLYFGDLSGTFYAVDRATGVSQWQIQPAGAIVGKPLATDEGIYFTTEDGSFISVSPEGNIIWKQTLETGLNAGPVASGDMVLITTSNPEKLLIAYDLNGVQKWSYGIEQ